MIDTVALAGTAATADIARRLRDAREARRPVRILGAGTWLTAGAPVEATESVSAAGTRGIIDYVPGDLTITVGAGTSLADIADATAANDQWATLDPSGSSSGSIGATIATASSGPLATAFGTPRDLILGFEAVTGTGAVIRGGGRVVKNVAGFDLTRLFTGSRGTLGVMTEVTLRLRARPARDVTVAIAIDGSTAGIRAIGAALRSWPFSPMAAEVIDGGCAAAIGLLSAPTLLVRLGGNDRSIASQRKLTASLGRMLDVDVSIWDELRDVNSGAAAEIRLSDVPSAFAERWDDARQLCGTSGKIFGSPSRGVIRCALDEWDVTRVASLRERARIAAIAYDVLPTPAAWHALTTEIESGSLAGRVRAAFDPAGILNPGIMRAPR